MDRKDLLLALTALGVLVLFLAQEGRIAGAPGFPLDDSWIHLHFARNLAEGAGFSYNPGHPVAGSTAPLWTLLLALGFALAGPALWVVKSLGVLLTLASALVTRRLAVALTGDPSLGLLAGVGVLLTPALAWGSLSGMEVPLAALLVTGAVYAHVTAHEWGTALLLGLAALARPESLLLVPLALFSRPLTLARTSRLLGAVGILLAPAVAFSLATVGAPVPATAAAKVEGGLLGLLLGARESWTTTFVGRPGRFLADWVLFLWAQHWFLLFLAPAGVAALWRQGRRAMVVASAVLILHPLGMALLAPYRGPAFQEGRYSAHLVPLAAVVAMAGLSHLPALWERGRGWIVLGWLAIAGAALWPASLHYAWAVQNINAMQVQLGEWVNGRLPKDARLAVNDVGAISFVSRREVIDLMGLVTPAIIPYRREGEAGILRYLEETCPDYLIIFPAWFPRLAALTERFWPVYRVRLEHNTVAGADEMVVYETIWNRWGRPPNLCGNRAGHARIVHDAPYLRSRGPESSGRAPHPHEGPGTGVSLGGPAGHCPLLGGDR